jgi:hypothetical protein
MLQKASTAGRTDSDLASRHDQTDRDRPQLAPPPPGNEPQGERPRAEHADPDPVGDHLERLGEILRGAELVGAQNRHLRRVRRQGLVQIVEEPEAIAELDDERTQVEDDVPVRGLQP